MITLFSVAPGEEAGTSPPGGGYEDDAVTALPASRRGPRRCLLARETRPVASDIAARADPVGAVEADTVSLAASLRAYLATASLSRRRHKQT